MFPILTVVTLAVVRAGDRMGAGGSYCESFLLVTVRFRLGDFASLGFLLSFGETLKWLISDRKDMGVQVLVSMDLF
jgi:hypothetical protein